jgi:hypothetical protein
MIHRFCILLCSTAAYPIATATDWIRPGVNTNQPVWGGRGGLLWTVAPSSFASRSPRGLLRLGYPVRPEHRYDLINFIAVEPIVRGRRGFSELEHSRLDNVPGKRIRAQNSGAISPTNLVAGYREAGPEVFVGFPGMSIARG